MKTKYVTVDVEGGKYSYTRSIRKAQRAFKRGAIAIGSYNRRNGIWLFDRNVLKFCPRNQNMAIRRGFI